MTGPIPTAARSAVAGGVAATFAIFSVMPPGDLQRVP